MEITQYHRMRLAVQSNASPGSATELRTVRANLQRALASVGLFEEVEVDYTDDLDHLVIGMFTFPDNMGAAEVARRLELMWQDRLRYPFWEAHAMLVDDDQVEFQGATRAGATGHYVTLHIVAQRSPIPAQRLASD